MSEPIWFMNTVARVLIDEHASAGSYDVVACTAPAGHKPPPHVHETFGEGWVVLEGELTVHTAAGPTVVRAGEAIFSPAGEAHTVEVTSDAPCRMLVSSVPSGFASFVRTMGEPAERDELPRPTRPDTERLMSVAADHGITMLPALPAPTR